MKRLVTAVAVLTVAVCSFHVNSFAKDDLNTKIEGLQKQIDELKAQNEEAAKKSYVGSKFPVELYGFIDVQPVMGTARTQMYGGLNSVAVQSRVVDKTTAAGGRHTWFGITPQNSRVGLNWKGSKVSDKLKIGGLIEIDFLNILNSTSYGTSPIPRIRHIYTELFSDTWSFLAGQTWDLFSPLNSASLSMGGNLWFQGNMGFRRPQARFTYNFNLDDINKFKVAVSANLPANTDDLVSSNGITSGIPLGEALVQYARKMKYGDFVLALSSVVGANNNAGNYSKIAGVAGSLVVPFHKYLKLSGEVHYGQDLGIFLSYANSAGNGSNSFGVRNTAAWGQITSQWCEKFDTAAGYAIDMVQSSKVLAGNVERNQVAFANFRFFPVKPFYVGLEYNYMRTNYRGNGSSPANVIFSNLMYYF